MSSLRPTVLRNQVHDPVTLDEVVFEADENPRTAWIALSAGAAPELIVDAPAFVPVGADDIESSEPDGLFAPALIATAENDVRSR